MSKNLEKELLEIAEWYTFNKTVEMGIDNRLAFLTKACDFLIWALARACEDIQVLEGRRRNGFPMQHDPYVVNAVPKNLRTAT